MKVSVCKFERRILKGNHDFIAYLVVAPEQELGWIIECSVEKYGWLFYPYPSVDWINSDCLDMISEFLKKLKAGLI